MSKTFNTGIPSPLYTVDGNVDTSAENSPATPSPINMLQSNSSRKGSLEESKYASTDQLKEGSPASATGSRIDLNERKKSSSPFLNLFNKKTPLTATSSLPSDKARTSRILSFLDTC
jgi:hypothetical protein